VSARLERVLLPGLVFAAILALWWAFVGGPGVADFPTPGRVWQAFRQLVEWPDEVRVPRLVGYAIASVFRVTWGFFLAVAVAVPLGLVLGWRTRLYRAFNPLIQILRPISPIAWIPIAILLLQNDDQRSIFLIFISTFFPVVVSTTAAVRNIPEIYIRSANNFGCRGLRLVEKVILPAALPQILVGLRIAVGIAWLVVVAAEMIAVESGLGYLIIDARNAGGRYDVIVAAMITIGVIGLALDSLIRRVERFRSVRWGYTQRG
jgi:NitT/TauT family transport system permease protein